MNELFQFAKKMLNQYGEFHPFGGYLNNSDIVVHVGIESGTSQDKVMRLKSSFKKLANEKKGKAFGIATDVTLPFEDGTKGDAINIFLEHRDGYCAEVFFRYELDSALRITDTIAQQGEPFLFSSGVK